MAPLQPCMPVDWIAADKILCLKKTTKLMMSLYVGADMRGYRYMWVGHQELVYEKHLPHKGVPF